MDPLFSAYRQLLSEFSRELGLTEAFWINFRRSHDLTLGALVSDLPIKLASTLKLNVQMVEQRALDFLQCQGVRSSVTQAGYLFLPLPEVGFEQLLAQGWAELNDAINQLDQLPNSGSLPSILLPPLELVPIPARLRVSAAAVGQQVLAQPHQDAFNCWQEQLGSLDQPVTLAEDRLVEWLRAELAAADSIEVINAADQVGLRLAQLPKRVIWLPPPGAEFVERGERIKRGTILSKSLRELMIEAYSKRIYLRCPADSWSLIGSSDRSAFIRLLKSGSYAEHNFDPQIAALWYLLGEQEGESLDPELPKFAEASNIVWCLDSLIGRLEKILDGSADQLVDRLSSVEATGGIGWSALSLTERSSYLYSVLTQLLFVGTELFEAATFGEVVKFVDSLKQLLEAGMRLCNLKALGQLSDSLPTELLLTALLCSLATLRERLVRALQKIS